MSSVTVSPSDHGPRFLVFESLLESLYCGAHCESWCTLKYVDICIHLVKEAYLTEPSLTCFHTADWPQSHCACLNNKIKITSFVIPPEPWLPSPATEYPPTESESSIGINNYEQLGHSTSCYPVFQCKGLPVGRRHHAHHKHSLFDFPLFF